MTELSQTLTTDYRTPQGDYQRIQYIPVSQSTSGLQQPQHIQLQVVQVAPVLSCVYFSLPAWIPYWHQSVGQWGSPKAPHAQSWSWALHHCACQLGVGGICTDLAVDGSRLSGVRDFCQQCLEIFSAAAKSLQSCLTLCDPIDGSPPGSPVPWIHQARTLEWVAMSFSNAWKWKVKVKSLSHVRLFATPWTAAYQAPLSMGVSRQEYWSGVPLPSLRDFL